MEKVLTCVVWNWSLLSADLFSVKLYFNGRFSSSNHLASYQITQSLQIFCDNIFSFLFYFISTNTHTLWMPLLIISVSFLHLTRSLSISNSLRLLVLVCFFFYNIYCIWYKKFSIQRKQPQKCTMELIK